MAPEFCVRAFAASRAGKSKQLKEKFIDWLEMFKYSLSKFPASNGYVREQCCEDFFLLQKMVFQTSARILFVTGAIWGIGGKTMLYDLYGCTTERMLEK